MRVCLHALAGPLYLAFQLGACTPQEEIHRASIEAASLPSPAGEDAAVLLDYTPVHPDSLGIELAAITVVEGSPLRYHMVAGEQVEEFAPPPVGARVFFHLQVDSAEELGRLLEHLLTAPRNLPNASAAAFPADMARLSVERKKEYFFRTLLPLVAFHNAVIEEQRRLLRRVQRQADAPERTHVQELGRYYALDRYPGRLTSLADSLQALLERVDRVPAPLVLAQAAIESGWGSSRFSREGNNLFGQRVWRASALGLRPAGVANPRFRLAVYPTISASVRSYMRNLNTHPAYAGFRHLRQGQRQRGEALDALALAGGLRSYSTRGQDYIDDLRRFMRYNNLQRFAGARLEWVAAL